MALRQVISKFTPLLSSMVKDPALLRPLGPCLRQPALAVSGPRLHQAPNSNISPPRTLGPCPPPTQRCEPCPCPETPQPLTLGERALDALWFVVKVGLFLAIVQLTVNEGLWGTCDDTEALAKRMGMLQNRDDEVVTDNEEETKHAEVK